MVQFSQNKVYSSSYVNNNGKESHYEKGAQSVNDNGKKNTRGFETKNGNVRELTSKEANKLIRQSQNTIPLKDAMREMDDVIGRFRTNRNHNSNRLNHSVPRLNNILNEIAINPINKSNPKKKANSKAKSYRKKRKRKKVRRSGKNRRVSIKEDNNTNQMFDRQDPPSFVKLNEKDRTLMNKTRRNGRKRRKKRNLKVTFKN